jgi:hypothetical protein
VSAAELTQRRASRAYALAVDVARPLGHGPLGPLLGLAAADDPQSAMSLARHPPRGGDLTARAVTRTLRVGVLGEIRFQGGRVADLSLPPSASAFGVDLGAATRTRSR